MSTHTLWTVALIAVALPAGAAMDGASATLALPDTTRSRTAAPDTAASASAAGGGPAAMVGPESAGAAAAIDSTLAAGAQLDSLLARIDAGRARLPDSERRVVDEMLAGAREMYDAGDLDAARLLAADALDFLRQKTP